MRPLPTRSRSSVPFWAWTSSPWQQAEHGERRLAGDVHLAVGDRRHGELHRPIGSAWTKPIAGACAFATSKPSSGTTTVAQTPPSATHTTERNRRRRIIRNSKKGQSVGRTTQQQGRVDRTAKQTGGSARSLSHSILRPTPHHEERLSENL